MWWYKEHHYQELYITLKDLRKWSIHIVSNVYLQQKYESSFLKTTFAIMVFDDWQEGNLWWSWPQALPLLLWIRFGNIRPGRLWESRQESEAARFWYLAISCLLATENADMQVLKASVWCARKQASWLDISLDLCHVFVVEHYSSGLYPPRVIMAKKEKSHLCYFMLFHPNSSKITQYIKYTSQMNWIM